MRVSAFVALVSSILHLDIGTLLGLVIASVILGSITHRLVQKAESGVALTIGGLVLLMIWVSVWNAGSYLEVIGVTVCLAVVGQRMYQRVLQA